MASNSFTLDQSVNFTSYGRTAHVNKILSQLSTNNSQVGHLLPLLLHYNHPLLPGFITDKTLSRITNYTPSETSLSLAKTFFNFHPNSLSSALENNQAMIDGLYTIGSLGSLGQYANSDWDVWICLTPRSETPSSNKNFTQKCQKIEQWAAQLGVELHLFLVNEDQFRQGIKSGFNKESSGSAQHWLLLDEFYRSSITLAGKPIKWQQVDPEKGLQTLDLGEPPGVPAQEYFGAMMWQLYKGIDSPEKSLLKALLLESYFNDFPHTVLLSQEWKEQLSCEQFIDHYALLINRITYYLTKKNDYSRLELARECFYLKCAPGLSYVVAGTPLSYQQSKLQELVTQWGFNELKIAHLDRQARWRPLERQQHHQALVLALLQGYQRMKKMASDHQVNEALYPQELAVISRKLYSAYHNSATKINRLASYATSKQANRFYYLRRGMDQAGQRIWLLLNQAPVFKKEGTIYQDNNIIKLLGWIAVNQLFSKETKIRPPADINKKKVNLAFSHIKHNFAKQRQATKNALIQANQIEQVLVLINMQDDATISFNGQTQIMDWYVSNIYSIGRVKHSLVSSIELIYRNSWDEHHAISFAGDTAILSMLCHLFTLIKPSDTTPQLNVVSLSEKHQPLLQDNVLFTIKECLSIIKKSNRHGIQVKSLIVAGKLYGVFFKQEQVEYKEISNALELYQTLSTSALAQLPNTQPTTSKIKRIIYQHGSIGYIQFFLERKKQGIKVYILDEHNNLSSYWQNELDEEQLVKEIFRFYTFTKDQQNVNLEQLNISFNLPQFYKILQQSGVIIIEPLNQQADESF